MARSVISCALIFIAGCALAQTAPSKGGPHAAEQAASLNAIREYALSYSRRLPDFTCTQKTRQTIVVHTETLNEFKEFDCGTKQNTWFAKPAIALAEGAGLPAPGAATDRLMGSSWRGEFGKVLDIVFDPETGADLRWDRVATLNGRRVSVVAFRVPQSRGYGLVESRRTIQVPFKGLVYADYETGAVVRIEMKCIDIPGDSEYKGADLTLEYSPAHVGGGEFMLPSRYLARFRMGRGEVTSEAEYTAWRRFSADTAIRFGDDEP